MGNYKALPSRSPPISVTNERNDIGHLGLNDGGGSGVQVPGKIYTIGHFSVMCWGWRAVSVTSVLHFLGEIRKCKLILVKNISWSYQHSTNTGIPFIALGSDKDASSAGPNYFYFYFYCFNSPMFSGYHRVFRWETASQQRQRVSSFLHQDSLGNVMWCLENLSPNPAW